MIRAQEEAGATSPDAGGAVVPKPLQYGIGVVLFTMAVVLPLLRQTGTASWRTIWAEDGYIFFQQAHRSGAFAVLFRGYAGYLQLPVRVLGGISSFVPFRQLALYLAVSAAVVNALLASFVYWASDGWVTSRLARLSLASLVVLMPVLGQDSTATITNTTWTFAAAAPWALVSLAERPRAVALRSIVAFLAATATAVATIFVPLAIGYALIRRTRETCVVAIAFCIGLGVQAGVALHTTDTKPGDLVAIRHASKMPELISVRVFAQYLLADKGIRSLWDDRLLLAVMAPIVVLAILVALLPGANLKNQVLAGSFVALAVVSFVVPIWARGTSTVALTARDLPRLFQRSSAPSTYLAANHYSVVPVMMLASAVAVLLAGPRRRESRRAIRIGLLVFVAHIALLTEIGFSMRTFRSHYRSWSSTVDSVYREGCAQEPTAKLVKVPTGWGPPLVVACRDLAP